MTAPYQEMVAKLGIRAALPKSAVVRLSVDRFSDEIFLKSVVFLQYFSDADRLLPTCPETKVALVDFLPTADFALKLFCLLYTSPSPRDATLSRMPSSA